jgi:hypothetical protein
VYRNIKTLDELTEQLKLEGFEVSRKGSAFVFCQGAAHLLKVNVMYQRSQLNSLELRMITIPNISMVSFVRQQ